MGDQELSRTDRVRQRSDFERAYGTGRKVGGRFMLVFLVPNTGSLPRLGVAAGRKFGGAVRRNRAKRLAREIFRRHRPSVATDIVIVPRREMLDASFPNLETDFLDILRRGARRDSQETLGPRRVPARPAPRV